ncbi:hypothetical protein, partial [Streptomyces diastaticus]
MARELQQQPSERGGQEGVRARLPVVVVFGGDGMKTRVATSTSIRHSCSGPMSSATAPAVSMSS